MKLDSTRYRSKILNYCSSLSRLTPHRTLCLIHTNVRVRGNTKLRARISIGCCTQKSAHMHVGVHEAIQLKYHYKVYINLRSSIADFIFFV